MNPHWGLRRTEEPIDSTSESSPSEEELLFLDPDIDVQPQEELDNSLDLLHQLSASLTLPQTPTLPSPTPIATQPTFPFLPPPPPAPSVIMTTTAKPIELWISTPKAYDGSFETSRQCLNAVQLYLLVNEDVYNNNDKKIMFILSYMTKGSALTWAATFWENSVNATGTVILGTYVNFIAKFNKDFKQRDVTEAAIAWLTTKRMVLKKDRAYSSPLNQYVAELQNHATWANIKDPNVLIRYFSTGIPPSLMRRIMSMDTILTTIQEWYSKAIHFQTQWEWAEEISKRNQCPTQHLYQPFTPTPSRTKDPNGMDVDVVRIGKLTLEERKRCIEKGLCFHCRKTGHLSGECPAFPNKKPGWQVKRIIQEEELPNLWEVDDDNEETVWRISFTPMDF